MSEFDPTKVDWGRTYVEAIEIARRFSAREAEDLVQQGMTLVIDGKAPFDPDGGKTLAAHLVGVALAEMRNRARVERLRKRRGQTAKLEHWMDEAPPTPEEPSHEMRLGELAFEAVVAACGDDARAREVRTRRLRRAGGAGRATRLAHRARAKRAPAPGACLR